MPLVRLPSPIHRCRRSCRLARQRARRRPRQVPASRRRAAAVASRRWSSAWRRRWSTSTPRGSSRTAIRSSNDPLFRQFFGAVPREQVQRSLGSGVIVDPSGLVVTNYHVIEGAERSEGRAVRQARVRRRDRAQGRAQRSHRAAPQGRATSDFPCSTSPIPTTLQVGDVVLAIGDPFGVGQTVTHGIVSARGAHPGRHQRLSVLHPDRRRHQSRQFRRRAGRSQRPARRHQHRDLFALRRLAGHRLRHPGEHGARRGRFRQEAAAPRSSGRGSAPSCRK